MLRKFGYIENVETDEDNSDENQEETSEDEVIPIKKFRQSLRLGNR